MSLSLVYPSRILSHHLFSSNPHNSTQLTLGLNRKFLPCQTDLSARTFCSSSVNGAFSFFFFFFGLEFPRDVSEMCCFIVKLTRTGEGSLSKLPTLIDSWPCKYSSGISESTKVDTSTELHRGVLFRIGTGRSIIFTDLNKLVPLLGSSTCNIPLFVAFLSKDLISLLNFPWFDFGFLIKALVSFKP